MTVHGFLFIAIAALIALPFPAAAQHSYGDGFGIGGVLLPSGSPTLLGNTRIGDQLGLEFGLELVVSDDGEVSTADIGAAVGIKKYLTDRNQFQPFYSGRFGFRHRSHDNGHNQTDNTTVGVTAGLGGESFITRKLSLEGQIGFDLYFGSIELGTSTRLAALFYL